MDSRGGARRPSTKPAYEERPHYRSPRSRLTHCPCCMQLSFCVGSLAGRCSLRTECTVLVLVQCTTSLLALPRPSISPRALWSKARVDPRTLQGPRLTSISCLWSRRRERVASGGLFMKGLFLHNVHNVMYKFYVKDICFTVLYVSWDDITRRPDARLDELPRTPFPCTVGPCYISFFTSSMWGSWHD